MDLGVSRRLSGADRTSESGIALLETMFAAVLLVVIALAVMGSLDVASKTSAASKGRSVASSLAEQDQERLRAMSIDQLSNYHSTNTLTVAGVDYSVDSRSEWIRDSNGAAQTCTSEAGQGNYVRISTTVTSNVVGKDIAPVTVRGIVSPPVGAFAANQGTLAVQVLDRNDGPVSGLNVTLSGTRSMSDATNSAGCAIFAYIPAGGSTSYTATLNSTGMVDQDGNQLSKVSPNVTANNVTLVKMTYDRAGQIGVVMQDSGGATPTPAPASLMVNNSKWITAGVRKVAPPTITSLFPFTSSPYSIYAGSCASADPALFTQTAASATALPGQLVGGVIVKVPTMTVSVTNNGAPVQANVKITPIGTGCAADAYPRQATPTSDGVVPVDLPYGKYTVCADITGRSRTLTPVNNDKPGGVSVPVNIIASGLPC